MSVIDKFLDVMKLGGDDYDDEYDDYDDYDDDYYDDYNNFLDEFGDDYDDYFSPGDGWYSTPDTSPDNGTII